MLPAGMSLVPLADAFNHKAAVVRLTADYAVQGASSDSDDGNQEDGSGDVDEANGEDGNHGTAPTDDEDGA